jgi:hypothetical protein
LLTNPSICQQMGGQARDRALNEFKPQQIWENWWCLYQEQLNRDL